MAIVTLSRPVVQRKGLAGQVNRRNRFISAAIVVGLGWVVGAVAENAGGLSEAA